MVPEMHESNAAPSGVGLIRDSAKKPGLERILAWFLLCFVQLVRQSHLTAEYAEAAEGVKKRSSLRTRRSRR